MVAVNMPVRDATLDEIHRIYLAKVVTQNEERIRRKAAGPRYIGASKIGHECDRHIYFDMTGAPQDPPNELWGNAGLLAAEDGHRSEPIMAARLRLVTGIELSTEQSPGVQWGFDWGFLRGNIDGGIRGLLQAPLTWHIWDHKRGNAKKFNKLVALVRVDEKSALEKWDAGYYSQQVIYMEAENMSRSYLTCSTDGFTDVTSVRTDANPQLAKALIKKAQRITGLTRAPFPVSTNDKMMPCLFCPHKTHCRSQP